ncbi:MAG: hypothetical protein ACOYNZ_07360 [Rhodoferax sp.]
MPKPAKAPAAIFVTDRIKDKLSDAQRAHAGLLAELAKMSLPADNNADDEFTPIELSKSPEQFVQPALCPIRIPKEFKSNWLRSNMFRLGVHQISHSLAGQLFAGYVDGVVLAEIAGGGAGRSYGRGGFGEDGARVSLAGLAGERLVAGEPLPMEGFRNDVESARKDLRDAGTSEDYIDFRMQQIYQQLQHTFQSWLPAIVDAATALTKRGVLDGKALFSIFSDAQENADGAGSATFVKSFPTVQIDFAKRDEYRQDVVRFKRGK